MLCFCVETLKVEVLCFGFFVIPKSPNNPNKPIYIVQMITIYFAYNLFWFEIEAGSVNGKRHYVPS